MEPDKLNFQHEFEKVLDNTVPINLLRYCLYSISQNDPAHDLFHVLTVCQTAKTLFDHFYYSFDFTPRDRRIVMTAALMHDLGCRYNRHCHHYIGHGLVYEYIHQHSPNIYSADEIDHIAKCVLEHRSSSRFKPTSVLSEIVKVADTGAPNLPYRVQRTVMFALSTTPENTVKTKENVVHEVKHYLIEKYGVEGSHWANYPDIGKIFFKEEWEMFIEQMNTPRYIEDIIDNFYDTYSRLTWSSYS